MSVDKAISGSDKAVSLWNVIAKNKLIFFSLYYSIVLYYSQYGSKYSNSYLDMIKEQMIKYNELVVYVIVHIIPIILVLELTGRLIKRAGNRESYNWIKVINIARKLEEIAWVLTLTILPIAVNYNTTLKEYWQSVAAYCVPFIFMYALLVLLHKKVEYTIDI